MKKEKAKLQAAIEELKKKIAEEQAARKAALVSVYVYKRIVHQCP